VLYTQYHCASSKHIHFLDILRLNEYQINIHSCKNEKCILAGNMKMYALGSCKVREPVCQITWHCIPQSLSSLLCELCTSVLTVSVELWNSCFCKQSLREHTVTEGSSSWMHLSGKHGARKYCVKYLHHVLQRRM
jgi:hypothetical protein